MEDLAENIVGGAYNHMDKMELINMVLYHYNCEASSENCPEFWSWRAEVWRVLTAPLKNIPLLINDPCLKGTKNLMTWRLTHGK